MLFSGVFISLPNVDSQDETAPDPPSFGRTIYNALDMDLPKDSLFGTPDRNITSTSSACPVFDGRCLRLRVEAIEPVVDMLFSLYLADEQKPDV